MPHNQVPFRPSQVLFVDVDGPLSQVTGKGSPDSAHRYYQAWITVRFHDAPIGTLQVEIPEEGVGPETLADAIWEKLGSDINGHLEDDGLSPIKALTAEGIPRPKSLPCWKEVDESSQLPFISVVIATRDRPDELERMLNTTLQLAGPPFEVIIVDNAASTDATERMVKEKFAHDERVRYVSQATPGISPARNRGIAEAKGEIIAFTDDDVVVDRNWLRAIARGFLQHPQADAMTGLVIPAAFETPSQYWFEEFGGFNKGYKPRQFTKERTEGDSFLFPYTAGSYGSGNNMVFRTKTLRAIGGFDVHLGVGCETRSGEDLDAYLTVVLNGGAIVYEPAAVISHFHRADYEGLRKQLYNYGVGLSALYTKWVLRKPWDIAKRLPLGFWYLLSPKSGKNEDRSSTFPKDLVNAELRGMLYGPIALMRSRKRR